MKKLVLMLTMAALLPSGAARAEEPMVLPIQRLAMGMAVKAAQATIAACRKEGLSVAVTIIDRGGHAQVVLRDSLAMPITVPISKQKAYAALNFNSPTSALESRFTSPFAPPKIDGLITSAGGLPITAGSTILGGIGVSGAPSGETDEACAAAGLKAITDDLEMAM
ncbi:MAG: heme-binding protein [Pseudomonadota bacterium]|nr:heme-binding protein [Pseudomonadota bacterium]